VAFVSWCAVTPSVNNFTIVIFEFLQTFLISCLTIFLTVNQSINQSVHPLTVEHIFFLAMHKVLYVNQYFDVHIARPFWQHILNFFKDTDIYKKISYASYRIIFLGTNSLFVLKSLKAVNHQSIEYLRTLLFDLLVLKSGTAAVALFIKSCETANSESRRYSMTLSCLFVHDWKVVSSPDP